MEMKEFSIGLISFIAGCVFLIYVNADRVVQDIEDCKGEVARLSKIIVSAMQNSEE